MTKQMRQLTAILVLLLLTSLTPADVSACTCNIYSLQKTFRESKVVFIGTVVSSTFDSVTDQECLPMPYEITLSVDKAWKGPKHGKVVVRTDQGESGCGGVRFMVGEQYLVYAYRCGDVLDASTGCSRIRVMNRLDEETKQEMKQLDSWWFRMRARLWRWG